MKEGTKTMDEKYLVSVGGSIHLTNTAPRGAYLTTAGDLIASHEQGDDEPLCAPVRAIGPLAIVGPVIQAPEGGGCYYKADGIKLKKGDLEHGSICFDFSFSTSFEDEQETDNLPFAEALIGFLPFN